MSLAKNVDFNSIRTRQLSAETRLDLPAIDSALSPAGPAGSIGVDNGILYVSDGSAWVRANQQDLQTTLDLGNDAQTDINFNNAGSLLFTGTGIPTPETSRIFLLNNDLLITSSQALVINTADGVNLVSDTKLAVPYAQAVLKTDFTPVTLDAMSGRVNYALGTDVAPAGTQTQTINCAAVLSNTSIVHVTSRNARLFVAPTTIAPGSFIVTMYNDDSGNIAPDFMFTVINNS